MTRRVPTASTASRGEIDRLLGWMPEVVRSAGLSRWERTFCASMIARTRRPTYTPSDRQVGHMQRLVGAFLAVALRDDDVVEQGDRA